MHFNKINLEHIFTVAYICVQSNTIAMASKNKEVKKTPSSMNVRIKYSDYELIRNFCIDRGYKLGVFMANASVNRILKESGRA